MANEVLDCVDLPAQGTQRGTVIWLHGLGADGHDFEPLIPELGIRERGMRVLLPHAPKMPVTLNGGMNMRAWYDIYEMSLARIDEAGIMRSVALMHQLIDQEVARGIASENILLAGFSQGGVIALHAGLTYGQALGGVMLLSGYIALPEALAAERLPANRQLPIFIGHGSEDPVVPIALAVQAANLLENFGNPLEKHLYRMEHSVSAPEIEHMKDWLQARIDGMAAA